MADKVTDGLKHDGGKPRLDLVPPEIIEAVGTVMTHGAEKYGEASYREVDPKRYRAALMRHVCKWLKDPYGKDEDSGLPHLWHIACNVAFLCELDKPETCQNSTMAIFKKLNAIDTSSGWRKHDFCGDIVWECPNCQTLGSPSWVCCPACGMDMRGKKE